MRFKVSLSVAAWWLSCLIALGAEPAQNALTPQELADGWVLLFDGETTFGWAPTTEANWKVANGVISVSEGTPGFLLSNVSVGDFELKVDFRAPAATNSGVFLRSVAQPKDPARDCYELNIAAPAISPFPTGSFVGRGKSSAEHKADVWRSFHVTAEGGKFVVRLDGQVVLEHNDPQPLGRGQIGLQFNTGKVEFRNVKLKPLGLKGLFAEKDLTGWKILPGDKEKSVFTVDPPGQVNIKNGPGQLESEARFGDFVLQVEAICHGPGLNSGIFFRSIPGERWNGYESQIHNGYRNGDRTQPVDFGTGAIYRRVRARKVVANDREWFHKTLIATGPQIAVWVNGYQVTDWTDTRPAHDNPRNGLRLAAGTLILQGHDPTTDLSFRKLRAVELPPRTK